MSKDHPQRLDAGRAGDREDSLAGETRRELVGRLFREHNDALVSLLALRLHSLQDAKEVAQEAYVRLMQLERPGAASLLRAYLFRIASNLAIDRLRQRTVRWRLSAMADSELFDSLSAGNEPERQVLAQHEFALVRSFMAELPDPCQRAFWLHRAHGVSIGAIAVELEVTERMVRHHLSRALLYCQLRLAGATVEQAKERLKR